MLDQIMSLFSTINFVYVLEINIFGRDYLNLSNLPKILISSTRTMFIVENWDNI